MINGQHLISRLASSLTRDIKTLKAASKIGPIHLYRDYLNNQSVIKAYSDHELQVRVLLDELNRLDNWSEHPDFLRDTGLTSKFGIEIHDQSYIIEVANDDPRDIGLCNVTLHSVMGLNGFPQIRSYSVKDGVCIYDAIDGQRLSELDILDIIDIPNEHIISLIESLEKLNEQKRPILVNYNPDEFIYSEENGFVVFGFEVTREHPMAAPLKGYPVKRREDFFEALAEMFVGDAAADTQMTEGCRNYFAKRIVDIADNYFAAVAPSDGLFNTLRSLNNGPSL